MLEVLHPEPQQAFGATALTQQQLAWCIRCHISLPSDFQLSCYCLWNALRRLLSSAANLQSAACLMQSFLQKAENTLGPCSQLC